MAKDMKAVALKAVQKKSINVEEKDNSSPQKSKLYKEYFSLETGEPIALDKISKRVKRRFSDIDRTGALAMMDLWFMHAQWNSFYSRTDSFARYVRDELEISRNHAYSILNSCDLLREYFIHKGNTDSEIGDFVQQITSSIDNIGIKKLSILSGYKSEEMKFSYLDRLLDGETITAETLLQKPEKKEKPPKRVTAVSINGDELKVADQVVLRFESQNLDIRKAIVKVVEKWYEKSLQPKKGK